MQSYFCLKDFIEKLVEFSVECFDGACVDKDNKHVIQTTSITGILNSETIIESITGKQTKEECLAACEKKRSEAGPITACEWKGEKDCHFFTKKAVEKGDGDKKFQCCIFNKG